MKSSEEWASDLSRRVGSHESCCVSRAVGHHKLYVLMDKHFLRLPFTFLHLLHFSIVWNWNLLLFYFWLPLISSEITLRVLFLYKLSWLIVRWTVILRTADHIQYYKQMYETVLGMCDKKDWFYHFHLPVRRRKPPGCVTGFELMDWCERGTRFSLNQQKKNNVFSSLIMSLRFTVWLRVTSVTLWRRCGRHV